METYSRPKRILWKGNEFEFWVGRRGGHSDWLGVAGVHLCKDGALLGFGAFVFAASARFCLLRLTWCDTAIRDFPLWGSVLTLRRYQGNCCYGRVLMSIYGVCLLERADGAVQDGTLLLFSIRASQG